MENKTYELFPVGKLMKVEEITIAQIMPDFCPALKNLELFSHAIMFLGWNKGSNLLDWRNNFKGIPKENFRITDTFSKSEVSVEVVQILRVDEKTK